jgi:DNA replication initiation complex subunit (GINS family)
MQVRGRYRENAHFVMPEKAGMHDIEQVDSEEDPRAEDAAHSRKPKVTPLRPAKQQEGGKEDEQEEQNGGLKKDVAHRVRLDDTGQDCMGKGYMRSEKARPLRIF